MKTESSPLTTLTRPVGFDLEELRGLAQQGLVSERRHPEADLSIFNYTPVAQYKGEWTDLLLACRGLILDQEGNVVARPFPKFFNLGEKHAATGNRWTVAEKLDGSLGIGYELDGELRLATRGSFESTQAIEGTKLLSDYDLDRVPGTTPLFEIILPENRIVVDYGDRRELIMLAAIDNQTGGDVELPSFSGKVSSHQTPESLGVSSLEDLIEREQANAEGWVARFDNGGRVKLKFKEYVRLHKILSGLNKKAVWDSLRRGDDLESLIEGVPDEVFEWATETRESLLADYRDVGSKARAELERRPAGSRREIAEYFLNECETPTGILFSMIDGKDPSEQIWKQVCPSANEKLPGSPSPVR